MHDYIHQVLVAADLSGASATPVARAAELARAAGARLEILYVATTRAQDGTKARLQTVAAGIRSRYGILVDVHLAAGRPHVAIASRAAEAGTDLVVLGAHRQRLVRDMFVPPTAERTRHEYLAPTLIVNGQSRERYERILLPTDFSPASAEAARRAHALFPAASMHYLHVFSCLFESRVALAGVGADGIVRYRNALMLDALQELERFVEREHPASRASLMVRHGHRAACIRAAAAQVGASLIVLGTGKSRIAAALLGSVTGELVERAPTDLLVVDARATALVRRDPLIGAGVRADPRARNRSAVIA